jgi:hypothetical protein
LTVDYERGNFSVSQCTWNDGAPEQINTILSPSYNTNNSSGSPSSHSSSSTKGIGTGAIAGIAIAGVALLAIIGALVYYFFFRKPARPVSTAHTDDIALANFDAETSKGKDGTYFQPSNSPYLEDKKLYSSDGIHTSIRPYHPDRELSATGEIHQLPTYDNHGHGIYGGAHELEDGRGMSTPEIDGTSVVYELHGSEPARSELDDTGSRRGIIRR